LMDAIQKKYGQAAKNRIEAWRELIESNQTGTDEEKLKVVNTFFNKVPFVSDWAQWGKEDYWATPVEFLATNGGDCDDYSMSKYFTLRALGIPDSKLKIMYVKALKYNEAHMVVGYYPTPESTPYILDNLIKNILPASKRTDLQPVYSFNGENIWEAKLKGQPAVVGKSSEINLWRDVLTRIDKETKGEVP